MRVPIASERLLFSLSIINQHRTPNVILKNVRSKQSKGCFLVYSATFLIRIMCLNCFSLVYLANIYKTSADASC